MDTSFNRLFCSNAFNEPKRKKMLRAIFDDYSCTAQSTPELVCLS